MKKTILAFFIMISLSLSCLYPSCAVYADENKYKELDLIMVLDQSGSMKTNDPEQEMLSSVKRLIHMMPAEISRVGIISFNREQTKVVGLTEINEDSTVSSIMKNVDQIEYTGDTDIGNAVSDAVDMFDFGDGREHAILVVSDGRNDFGFDRNEEKESDERLSDSLITARKQDCKIFCLGFGSEMADTNDVPYKKLASIASNDTWISTETDPNNIQDFFYFMIATLMNGFVEEITDNKITIKDNVKEANVYLKSKESLDDIKISLTDPDGNTIDLEDNDEVRFYKDPYTAVIKLYSPDEGTYIISTSSDKVEVNVGYVAFYEYYLMSSITDGKGVEITQIDNGKTGEIRTVIRQDGEDITDEDVYRDVTATAVVTAKDTGEEQNVALKYDDGYLRGRAKFDHVATYAIDISVDSDSFQLSDSIDIQANKRGVSFEGAQASSIEKKVIDKTFKDSNSLLVSKDELMSVVSDPDNVGVEIAAVTSDDEETVTAEMTEDGIDLTGKQWGSSIITVTYKDGLGNTVQSEFTTRVTDKVLVALFAALPILIATVVVLIVYFTIKKSRIVAGDIEIKRVTINKAEEGVSVISLSKKYKAKTLVGRKKTLGSGIAKYAQNVYTIDSTAPYHKEFYEMFSTSRSELRKNLDDFKFIGSYLGKRGCSVKIKKNSEISIGNNKNYGKAVKLVWRNNTTFKVYTKDSSGTELCIEGSYSVTQKRRKSAKKAKSTGYSQTKKDDFEDGFFL